MIQPYEVDESKVIDILLQSSPEFKEFYNNERSKIGKIKWCIAPDLPKRLGAEAAH